MQVKSTMFKDRGGYSCTVRGSEGPYEGDPFEYLAAYVFHEDMCYIIPGEMVVGREHCAVSEAEGGEVRAYKEAWHLLRREAAKPTRVAWIEACVEEAPGDRVSLGERICRVLRAGT